MRNIFSYESRLTQGLLFLTEMSLLNLQFLLCCIPIFTIGAAQSALYSGIRALRDPDSELSPTKAYWKAFRTGFLTVTLAWGILFLLEVVMTTLLFMLLYYSAVNGGGAPVWMCVLALAMTMLLQCQVTLFHARFSCTFWQLLRNSCFMLLSSPLRTLIATVLLWLPVGFWLLSGAYTVIRLFPLFLLIYYSAALLGNLELMKKPYDRLIAQLQERQEEQSS